MDAWSKDGRECPVDCLTGLVMWMVVAPVLGVAVALALATSDPLWIVVTALLGLLVFVLYLLATWGA